MEGIRAIGTTAVACVQRQFWHTLRPVTSDVTAAKRATWSLRWARPPEPRAARTETLVPGPCLSCTAARPLRGLTFPIWTLPLTHWFDFGDWSQTCFIPAALLGDHWAAGWPCATIAGLSPIPDLTFWPWSWTYLIATEMATSYPQGTGSVFLVWVHSLLVRALPLPALLSPAAACAAPQQKTQIWAEQK